MKANASKVAATPRRSSWDGDEGVAATWSHNWLYNGWTWLLLGALALWLTMRAHGAAGVTPLPDPNVKSNYVPASMSWAITVSGPVKIYDGTNWNHDASEPVWDRTVHSPNLVADWDSRPPVCLVWGTNVGYTIQPAAIIEEFPDGMAATPSSRAEQTISDVGVAATYTKLESPRGRETFTAIIPRVKRLKHPPTITPLPTLSPPLPP